MAATMVSDITKTSSLISDAGFNIALQADNGQTAVSAVTNAATDGSAVLSDTVSISSQSRQVVAGETSKEPTPEVAKKEKAKKDEAKSLVNGEGPVGAQAKVEFVYNQRGELIVKYKDASNRLVYQIPSELMIFQREMASKAGASVDKRV